MIYCELLIQKEASSTEFSVTADLKNKLIRGSQILPCFALPVRVILNPSHKGIFPEIDWFLHYYRVALPVYLSLVLILSVLVPYPEKHYCSWLIIGMLETMKKISTNITKESAKKSKIKLPAFEKCSTLSVSSILRMIGFKYEGSWISSSEDMLILVNPVKNRINSLWNIFNK